VLFLSESQNIKVLELLEQGLENFKNFDKLWLMKVQYFIQTNNELAAFKTLKHAVKHVPFSQKVWLEYARLEISGGNINKARAILETARSKIQKNDIFWLTACEL
jgi:pre-mRNA-processing factor 6